MDEPKKLDKIVTLQRRTVPGPRQLSEVAKQTSKQNIGNAAVVQKDKKFAVISVYNNTNKTNQYETFENLKLEGVITILNVL